MVVGQANMNFTHIDRPLSFSKSSFSEITLQLVLADIVVTVFINLYRHSLIVLFQQIQKLPKVKMGLPSKFPIYFENNIKKEKLINYVMISPFFWLVSKLPAIVMLIFVLHVNENEYAVWQMYAVWHMYALRHMYVCIRHM